MPIYENIEKAYRETLEKKELTVTYWYEYFGLKGDPFNDSIFEKPVNSELDWFINFEGEAEELSRYTAMSDREVGGNVLIIGAQGAGRKTLIKLVFKILEKEITFKNLNEEFDEGKVNIIIADRFWRVHSPPERSIEFVIITPVRYWAIEKIVRDNIVSKIWVKPIHSSEIKVLLEKRLLYFSEKKRSLYDFLEEAALRELCKYSQGLIGAALYIADRAFKMAFKDNKRIVARDMIIRIAEIEGYKSAYYDFPKFTGANKRIAKLLVESRGGTTIDLKDRYEELYEESRDRSIFSRHLNRLVKAGLAERTEVGRAARYEPTRSLELAVSLEEYPR